MKIALITTTIHVPHALKAFREANPDVIFILAGDRKTPDVAVTDFLLDVPNHLYIGADLQSRWRHSAFLGWNTIARRNIALLEALKWGADIIVSWDDDNFLLSTDYFDRFEMLMARGPNYFKRIDAMHLENIPGEQFTWTGLSVSSMTGWFDSGSFYQPPVRHRGYPHQVTSCHELSQVANVKIGAASGVILGDPDISAIERIAKSPEVHGVSELLKQGIVVDPNTYAPFNTQNTAYLREFAPCFLMCPQFGRYDDIWASLLCQRIMREKDYRLHIGQPFVWQQRNEHDLVADLKAEMLGTEYTPQFAKWLNDFKFESSDVNEMTWEFYQKLPVYLPSITLPRDLYVAWFEDVQEAMKC